MAMTLHAHDILPSTQDEARHMLDKGAVDAPFIVMAGQQSKGRGRHGRTWFSPAGNLSMTAVLRPDRALAEWSQVSLLVGVAVSEVLRDIHAALDGRLRLKWPNDLLVDGAKLGGILCEAEHPHMLVGIGLNLAHAPEVEGRKTTSLAALGFNRLPDAPDLALRIGSNIQHWLRKWEADGLPAIRSAWLAEGPDPGTPVTDGARKGGFAGLGPRGEVLMTVEALPEWELPADRI